MARVYSLLLAGVLILLSAGTPALAQQIPTDTSQAQQQESTSSAVDTVESGDAATDMARDRGRFAQQAQVDGSGTAILADWPPSLPDLIQRMGRRAPRLLPKIDTLSIDYDYVTGEDMVDMRFGIQWQAGESVLYEGSVVTRREGPRDIRMSSFEIILDVVKGGQKVAETVVAVDSMALPQAPGYYEFSVQVPYERVFLDSDAQEAELYLRQGVTFERPLIEVVGFREYRNGQPYGAVQTSRQDREPQARPAPGADPPRVVYRPGTRVLIGWRVGPQPYYVGPSQTRRTIADSEDDRVVSRAGDAERTGRAATAGRSNGAADNGAGRTGRTSGTASSGDDGKATDADEKDTSSGRDDDDDDDDLATAALGAAAVVAGVAYFGGTVGIYGTGETPLGLTAGVTKPRGGVHLQAAVNSEVIEQEGVQRLNAKLMGFYDVVGTSPVQPAAAVGVQAVAIGDNTEIKPAVSLGLVLNTGRFVVFSGYDMVRTTPEISLTYNFRYSPKD
ncbi:hypothetical protein [Longibacter salinarum]|nr:hypothetical protein [Longibacter salinarum]